MFINLIRFPAVCTISLNNLIIGCVFSTDEGLCGLDLRSLQSKVDITYFKSLNKILFSEGEGLYIWSLLGNVSFF